MRTLFVYIPGLGDEEILQKQRDVVAHWQNDKRTTLFLESGWNDTTEPYAAKYNRLLQTVRAQAKPAQPICLVGTSAGGSLGLNIFHALEKEHQICFVSVGGKITGSTAIGSRYSRPHPALVPSVQHSEEVIRQLTAMQKQQILNVFPLLDEVVFPKYMKVPNAIHRRTWTIEHVFSIWWVIRYRPNIIFSFAAKVLD